jgi:DNA polymerase elongation subunit (family B)
MQNTFQEIVVHSYDWQVSEDQETGNTNIHCWGLDRDSKPHLLRIRDFEPFCYVELPKYLNNSLVQWRGFREKLVYQTICNMLGEDQPHKYEFCLREKLYFYKGETDLQKKYPMLLVYFRSLKSMNTCKYKLQSAFKVQGLKGSDRKDDTTMLSVKVWETHIPLVRKLLTIRDCKFSQWFKIQGVKVSEENKISNLEHEYAVNWRTLTAIPVEESISWISQPKIMSFDIETYSDKHNMLPDPLCAKHVVYLISIVTQIARDPSSRKREIILFGDCSPTNLATVTKVKTEGELLNVFQQRIAEYNPDVITGYNILGYDNIFLDTRLNRRLQEWKPITRIVGKKPEMTSISWSSSAYKNQDFNILEMEGRITIDVLPIIKRDFKLRLYNLDFVSNHFLGRGKHDIKAKEQFEIYELQTCLKPDFVPSDKNISEHFINTCNKKDIKDKKEIARLWIENCRQYALDEMKRVVDYCVTDSDLTLDLFEKVNIWIGLVQMSNIMGTTPTQLFTRGTGLRMESQIYDEAVKNNTVLDEFEFPEFHYCGGFVFDPVPGLYHNIAIYDFSSLYPSIMRRYNIDHKTLVPAHLMDQVPDELCHVIEWTEEEEEEEDSDDEIDEPEQQKKKEKKKMKKEKKVKHYKYKFVKNAVGLMPKLLERLIAERNAVRAKQKKVDEDSLEWSILEQTQLGIKIICNAFYGSCGSGFSKLRLPYAAAAITARARESTKKMNGKLESKGHKIIYGDTDSTMPDIGITDPKKAWEMAEIVRQELTSMFEKPMNIELEAIGHTMLCIKKKMYLCIYMDKNGDPIEDPDKMKIRGVTLARRDNCKFQKDFYKAVVWKVMHRFEFLDVFNFIIDKCISLMTRQVPVTELTMVKGLGSNYKSKTYMMSIFAEEMQKSGNPMSAGERINYILVKTNDEVKDDTKVGYKMRTPDIFMERAESANPEHIDYLYYLEKTIRNGIEKQLWQVGYKKELEEYDTKFKKMDIAKFFKVLETDIVNSGKKINESMKQLRINGYKSLLEKLHKKHNGNEEEIAKNLAGVKEYEKDVDVDTTIKKIAYPLYTFYIKRRMGRGRRLSTRIDKEPIMMMVRLMQQKAYIMQEVKNFAGFKKKEKKQLKLNVISTKNNQIADEWIKNKTQQMKLQMTL